MTETPINNPPRHMITSRDIIAGCLEEVFDSSSDENDTLTYSSSESSVFEARKPRKSFRTRASGRRSEGLDPEPVRRLSSRNRYRSRSRSRPRRHFPDHSQRRYFGNSGWNGRTKGASSPRPSFDEVRQSPSKKTAIIRSDRRNRPESPHSPPLPLRRPPWSHHRHPAVVQGGENTRNHFGSDPPVPPRAKAFGELLGVSIYGSRSSSSIHGNPFQKIECVPSQSEWKDVFDLFDFETLHVLIPDLEDFIRLPNLIRFEVQSDFAAVIHGKYIRAQGYIMDSGKRVWHEDATWLKVFYGRTMLEMEIPLGIGLVQDGRSPGHPNWRLLLVVVLNRMRLVSGGLLIDQKGKDRCFHGVIALQTIREMLHWRNIFRNIAHKIGDAEYSHIRYGTFTVSEDEELCLNGSAVAEVEYLDPTKWRSERYLALGLVAWVNMRIDVIVNAKDLLQSMELSHNGISDWCWAALQFGAGKDVQSAVAFVGLLRFLFVRNHLPDECAAATHFCANEFLDRANGVPELESCLPELLGASKTFSRGFDIDTGAVTRAAVMRKRTAERTPEVERYSTSRDSENRPRHVLNIQRAQALALKNRPPSSSGVSCKGLDVAEERQVVLSAWTYRPDGTEWQVPRTVSQHIDFMKNDIKYRMSIRRGEVTCQRVGKMRWFREQLGRISEIQIMGNDIARQPRDDDDIFVSGGLAISNSLGGEYGEEVCLHVLSWLHRGMIRLNPGSTASAFVPKSSITTDGLTVNQHLSYEICRNFVFARRGHELFWLPGDGLPCFRMANCPNGKYQLCEEMKLPYGVKRCRAEIAKDFG